jgi:hypothetical protein
MITMSTNKAGWILKKTYIWTKKKTLREIIVDLWVVPFKYLILDTFKEKIQTK